MILSKHQREVIKLMYSGWNLCRKLVNSRSGGRSLTVRCWLQQPAEPGDVKHINPRIIEVLLRLGMIQADTKKRSATMIKYSLTSFAKKHIQEHGKENI